jgi:transcriptional regulator with XRE-family HTH domain
MDHTTNSAERAPSLQEGRFAKGYSLEDLAIATGLTVDEIEAAERGDQVPEDNLERIGHALR